MNTEYSKRLNKMLLSAAIKSKTKGEIKDCKMRNGNQKRKSS